jgi:hypothetical protein
MKNGYQGLKVGFIGEITVPEEGISANLAQLLLACCEFASNSGECPIFIQTGLQGMNHLAKFAQET